MVKSSLRYVLVLALVSLALPVMAAGPAPAASRALAAEKAYQKAIAKVVPTYVMIAGGSGVVISKDGLMLTNHHVIARGYNKGKKTDWAVRIGAKDKQFYKADILGTDPIGDITLLKIKDSKSLPFVEFTDSDALVVGQQVIAVGNPFGAMEGKGDPTVTIGVVSCLHRFRDTYSDAIQTDAPINPGNSGGPLLTMDGKLAGINGRIATKHGARANTGIGLAIPANQIKRFLPLLKDAKAGMVHHAQLRGIKGETEEKDGIQNGAEIKEVRAGSSAAKVGLKAGDRITHVDDISILNMARLYGVIGTYPAGSEVVMRGVREGKPLELKVKLERYDRATLGFTVFGMRMNSREAVQLQMRLRRDRNAKIPVKVDSVDASQPAAKAGLKKGDIILEVDGEPMTNLITFMQHMRKVGQDGRYVPGEIIKLKIRRGKGAEQLLDVPLGSSISAFENKTKGGKKPPKKK